MTWNSKDDGHEAAAGGWTVGDRVAARANEIKVRAGSRGTVVGFSAVGGHPLVDFAGFGLVLIRAEHLARDDDATPEPRVPGGRRSPGTTRLSDTPRARAVAAAPPPPMPDWFDRPSPLPVSQAQASPRGDSGESDLEPPGDLSRSSPHGAAPERRPDEPAPGQERQTRAVRGAKGVPARR